MNFMDYYKYKGKKKRRKVEIVKKKVSFSLSYSKRKSINLRVLNIYRCFFSKY